MRPKGRLLSSLQGRTWRWASVMAVGMAVATMGRDYAAAGEECAGSDELPDETWREITAAEDTRLLEGHDLAGRLFHTLLTDAKFTGAYYTSVPAATMLSRLVFEGWPQDVDWSDHEFPASLSVADLACGTGTLLMAVATEAQRRHEAAGGRNSPALHKAMVEQALHGYDVQLSAIHFAATSLAMLNPEIQFDHMNLYVMPFGAEGSELSLGSLDFLGTSEAAVQYALSVETLGVATQEVERVSGSGTRAVGRATLPDLDLAIMNPPFTRSVGGNLLFGSLPAGERLRLQHELSRRLKHRQATVTAGLVPFPGSQTRSRANLEWVFLVVSPLTCAGATHYLEPINTFLEARICLLEIRNGSSVIIGANGKARAGLLMFKRHLTA